MGDGRRPDTRLSIDLLGRFQVRLGERVVLDDTWPRGKAKAILKLLALQPDHQIQRDQLLDLIWPDLGPDAAANNLRKNLSLLRSELAEQGAPNPIERSRGEMLALSQGVGVDLAGLREHVESGAACKCSPEEREAATNGYTGQLLPQDRYEDWAQEARDTVLDLQITLLQDLCQRARKAGALATAERAVRRIIDLDPLREDAYRSLMQLYADDGNLGAAAYVYRRCRAELRDELEIEPSEDTQRLYREVVTTLERQPAPPCPEVRHATTSDGVDVAYWTLGEGTPLLYMPAIPYTHIGAEWNVPPWRDLYLRMAAPGRMVIRYDTRGAGLSDRAFAEISLDTHLADIEAVVSALHINRFAILADRHASVPSLAYAARHPDQVTHLVLWSGYANGKVFGALPRIRSLVAIMENEFDMLPDFVAGINMGTSLDDNPEELRPLMAEFVRAGLTQEQCLAICYDHMETDVTGLLPQVEAPVLMFDRVASRVVVPDELLMPVVDGLPDCTLVIREGEGTHPMQGDIEEEQALIDQFLAEN